MGQHKYNETAKLAKEGKLPPRDHRLTKAELRMLNSNIFKSYKEAFLQGRVIEERINGTFLVERKDSDINESEAESDTVSDVTE